MADAFSPVPPRRSPSLGDCKFGRIKLVQTAEDKQRIINVYLDVRRTDGDHYFRVYVDKERMFSMGCVRLRDCIAVLKDKDNSKRFSVATRDSTRDGLNFEGQTDQEADCWIAALTPKPGQVFPISPKFASRQTLLSDRLNKDDLHSVTQTLQVMKLFN